MELFEEQKRKGKTLLVILGVLIFFRLISALNGFIYLISKKWVIGFIWEPEDLLNLSPFLFFIDILLNFIVIVFAVAILKRKIWGLYALGVYFVVIEIIVPIIFGATIIEIIIGLVWLGIWGSIFLVLWADHR